MTGVDARGIYFDGALLGKPDFNYICWLDVMGTTNQMERSVPTAATFIFKLHCAVPKRTTNSGRELAYVSTRSWMGCT